MDQARGDYESVVCQEHIFPARWQIAIITVIITSNGIFILIKDLCRNFVG